MKTGFTHGLAQAFAVATFALLAATAASQPIEIDSIEELQLIGNDPGYPLDGDYVLTQDIDASVTQTWNGGEGFAPIGPSGTTPVTGYPGGRGHVGRVCYVNLAGKHTIGFLTHIHKERIVENISMLILVLESHTGCAEGRNSA